MPKLKTKRGVKKRFRMTKSGRIKRSQGGKSHILSSKKESRKRRLKRAGFVSRTQGRMIKICMPYGSI